MKINDICKCLIETSESPTHFMIVRQVKSVLHKLNPWPELNIDRQLDMYVIHFYDNDIELSTKMQFGVDVGIFYEDKPYPLYCLFMACVGKNIQLKNGKLPIPFVSAMLPDLDIDKAEELAWETDYACFAVEEDGNEINKADAGAFFLEGYNYAKGNLR